MSNGNPIEHVIVLMMENHTFDNALGYLGKGDGVSPAMFNLVDPANPASQKVSVGSNATDTTDPDPLHDLTDTTIELFAPDVNNTAVAQMSGFVYDYTLAAEGDVETGKNIMQCYNPVALPTLSGLAREFCLCDRWFASLPGPTFPNRFFVHAATSDGQVGNSFTHDYDMNTIYNNLADNGLSWRIYFEDITECFLLRRLWDSLDQFRFMFEFFDDVDSGNLPNYSFLEPRFNDFLFWKANDQHPSHSMQTGELFINEVYARLRANEELWNKTLLIVVYDEHGGFYDHVPPPPSPPFQNYNVPNPDGKVSTDPPFAFDRLGLRVPAILISPYIEQNTLSSTIFEHSSVAATLAKIFNLPTPLTERDKAANTFEGLLTRTTPRETPTTFLVPGDPLAIAVQRELLRTTPTEENVVSAMSLGEIATRPLSDFQRALVGIASRLDNDPKQRALAQAHLMQTEHQASVFIQERVNRFLAREQGPLEPVA